MSSVNFIEEQLGVAENESLADVRRRETLIDLDEKLANFGKCALVRCTGFGKTWMLTNLLREYKKVLYLYPAEVVKNTVVSRHNQIELGEEFRRENNYDAESVRNTTFMTYMRLIKLGVDDFESMDYDLVIFDECHRLGAAKTKEAVGKLFKYLPDAKFVGATATPERGDAFDVIETFFDNICVKQYTLHDAIRDGIEQKPYYIFCRTDIEADIRDSMKERGLNVKDDNVLSIIQSRVVEGSKLYNMGNIIKETLNKFRPDDTYFKFIVFHPTIAILKKNADNVYNWFHDALGKDYTIRELRITSASKKESENVNELNTLTDDGTKRVDLIHCVDMLNMGYHIDDITGIIMYRGTSSSIIFNQQLGRALSTGSSRPCLVFDVVDNLHRKAVFELTDKKGNRKHNHLQCVSEYCGTYTVDELMNMSDDEIVELASELLDVDEGVNITVGNSDIEELRGRLLSLLKDGEKQWWKFCNDIIGEDITLTGFEASYMEFIAKAVAEPLAFRARSAIANHYLLYQSLGNKSSKLSTTEIYKVGDKESRDFLDFMKSIVKDDDSDYPIFSTEQFRKKFIDTDENVFKQILSCWNVTIREILDVIECN